MSQQDGVQPKKRPRFLPMTLDQMNADLARYDDFEQISNRVGYWSRRFALTKPTQDQTGAFDNIVAKHSMRALAVLRAG